MSPQAGTVPAQPDFAGRAEPFRRELLAHCYRLLGSVEEAEDLVQETYLRAWRAYGGFEGRSSLRSWLYRIATNACLTALEQRGRRVLPSGPGAPGRDPQAVPAAAAAEAAWLQPIPDALVLPQPEDPADVAVSRESLRLALIAALQYLPARQRAVLLLRDVLAFEAAEVAAMLGTSIAAVKSLLQRARARLAQAAPEIGQVSEPTGVQARELLSQYIAAFENADAAALAAILRRDFVLELPPSPDWFTGAAAARHARQGLGSPGTWRMVPTAANGQPAAAAYRRAGDGVHRAFGVAVLTVTPAGISRVAVFADPGLLARFGLPGTHTDP